MPCPIAGATAGVMLAEGEGETEGESEALAELLLETDGEGKVDGDTEDDPELDFVEVGVSELVSDPVAEAELLAVNDVLPVADALALLLLDAVIDVLALPEPLTVAVREADTVILALTVALADCDGEIVGVTDGDAATTVKANEGEAGATGRRASLTVIWKVAVPS